MRSIQTKISIVILVIMLIATLSLMTIAMLRNRSLLNIDSDKYILSAADYQAGQLNDIIRGYDDNAYDEEELIKRLQDEVMQISVYGDGSAFLLTADGNIVYHPDYPEGIQLEDIPEEKREHFQHLQEMKRNTATWHNCPDVTTSKFVIKELKNGMLLGVTISRKEIAMPQVRLFVELIIASFCIVIFSVIIGILWVRSIIKPLWKMTVVADHYACGDYSEQMTIDSRDELGRLSKSLQTMSTSMKRQVELADAANRAKSAFLSNMSHEIRTPITAVLGFNEMILRESADKDVLMYAENIKAAGNTLLGLINDVLDFSRIEAGKIEIIPADYDPAELINDLVSLVRIRAEEKGLSLDCSFDSNIPRKLYGDEVRIKQVITNILTNAVKYTKKGGVTFTINYEKDETDPECILLNVSVKDTGIGIKKEDLQKLFSEFERLDEKQNRNIEGTGLGMNITKSLLEMMGSTLKVESIYGVGSDFSFSLKQKVVEWEAMGDYQISGSYGGEIKLQRGSFTAKFARVLMVDDTSTNLLLFKSLLKQTLVRVDTADSGEECIRLCQKAKYDVIFLDHMMPGKNGIETLHEIKEDVGNPNLNTPIICLTANAISGVRKKYLREGFDDYLTKPIDPRLLEETLLRFLPPNKIDRDSDGGFLEFEPKKKNKATEDSELSETLDALRKLEQIDTDTGLRLCGTEAIYLSILRSYYDTVEETTELLRSLLTDEDYEYYTIRIHSLKSSSRTIGATELGSMAEKLEHAGKNSDKDFLRKNNEAFLQEYQKLKESLRPIFENTDIGLSE